MAPDEAARSLHDELRFFIDGGILDLSSQQRVLRVLATVLMQEGLLEPDRIEAAIRAQESVSAPPSVPPEE